MEDDDLTKNKPSSSHKLDVMNETEECQIIDANVSQFTPSVCLLHRSIPPKEVPRLGMEFDTEEDANQFYLTYAKKIGFGTKKHKFHRDKKSGKLTSRIFCCSAEGKRGEDKRNVFVKAPRPETRFGCMARMTIRRGDNEKYRVTDFISEHTHSLVSPCNTHLFKAHKRVDEANAIEIEMIEGVAIAPKVSRDLVIKKAGGREKLGYVQEECKNYLRSKRTRNTKVGDIAGVLEYLQEMQLRGPNFSHSIQVDEDGLITNIFWADGRMKADYAYFGDVVCFDTTYRKNVECRPFALFVGVNHHKQTIIFGVALLYDDTIPSFQWLFDVFASTMRGKRPITILTDEDLAMANALASRWPDTQHRLCIWQIYQNAIMHLSSVCEKFENFSHDLEQCIYEFEEEEDFLNEWNKMLARYDLQENDWLKRKFELKEKWALAYGRQYFCADITMTQRSGRINSVVKRYASVRSNLRIFFERLDNVIESCQNEELKADLKASASAPELSIPTQLLKHAASLYTPGVFEVFQDELYKAYDCIAVIHCTMGTVKEYHVTSLGRTKHHVVKYNSLDGMVNCSCKKFEFSGVLCSHALKVMTTNNTFNVPVQYILKRWTKSAKDGDLRSGMVSMEVDTLDPKIMMNLRQRELSMLFNQLAMRASQTKETYEMFRDYIVTKAEEVDIQLRSKNLAPEESNVRIDEVNSRYLYVAGDKVDETCLKANGTETETTVRLSKRLKSGLEKNSRKKKHSVIPISNVSSDVQPIFDERIPGECGVVLHHDQVPQYEGIDICGASSQRILHLSQPLKTSSGDFDTSQMLFMQPHSMKYNGLLQVQTGHHNVNFGLPP